MAKASGLAPTASLLKKALAMTFRQTYVTRLKKRVARWLLLAMREV